MRRGTLLGCLMSHACLPLYKLLIDQLRFYLFGGKCYDMMAANTIPYLMRPTHWLAWHARNDGGDASIICNTQLPHPGSLLFAARMHEEWEEKKGWEKPLSPVPACWLIILLACHFRWTVNINNLSPSYVLPSGTASPSPAATDRPASGANG